MELQNAGHNAVPPLQAQLRFRAVTVTAHEHIAIVESFHLLYFAAHLFRPTHVASIHSALSDERSGS